MITIAPQPASLVEGNSQHLAYCWKLTPVLGTVVRLTSHNRQLTLRIDGVDETFVPLGSITRSALRRETGLAEMNVAFSGAGSAAAITIGALRAGQWDDAQVDEYRGDWRFPWVGKVTHNRFWVDDAQFNRNAWTANISGIVRWLRSEAGEVITRSCGWPRLGFNFGTSKAGCHVDVAALTFTGVEVAAVTSNRIFTTDTAVITPALGPEYFTFGVLVWLTGDNAGAQNEVRKQDADVAGAYTLELALPCAYPIQVGDTFSIEPGDDRRAATCKNKFANFVNFNGADELPDSQTTLGVVK